MKKIVNIVKVIAVVLCVCVMAACSDGSDSGAGTGTGEIDTNRYVYREFDLNRGYDDIWCTYLKDNDFYYISYSFPDYQEDDEKESSPWPWVTKLHLYKTESGENTILCNIEHAVTDIAGLYVTEQNQIMILYSSNNEDESESETLVSMMPDGTEVSSVSLSDKIEAFLGEGSSIGYTEFEQDGYLYAKCSGGGESVIVRFDMEGNVTGSVPYNEVINGIFLDNEKKPAVVTHSDEGLEYTYMDFEKGECGEIHFIQNEEEKYSFGSASGYDNPIIYNGYGDVTCYIRDVDGCLTYNEEKQELTYLFDWTKTGIVGGFVDNMIALEDGRIFCSCGDVQSRTYGFVEQLEEGKEKKVIKCAALNPDSDYSHQLEENITNYNKSNSDYVVELVSYGKSESPIDAFAKDVIAGNIPDVLDISGVEVMSYINQGFFEDLAPYMEKDNEFGKDYYVDGLYDAIAVDGAQYYTIKYFGFTTISGKASDTEQYKDGWTMEDMIDYYRSKPEGTMLCPHETKSKVFDYFVAPCIDDYIDWGTGKVSFDSDGFREIAAFCNEFPLNDETAFDNGYMEVSRQMCEGKILIKYTLAENYCMDGMQCDRELFGGDFRCIGFPSADKKKAYITPYSVSLAMTSSSEEKEAAWDFIKSVITSAKERDKGDRNGAYPGIPSGKKEFEKLVEMITATEKYIDEDGRVINPIDFEGGINDFRYTARPLTEEEINDIRGLIKNSAIQFDNSTVLSMVESEMNDYFNGIKTLDDTISVLQDRVGKYVNENR